MRKRLIAVTVVLFIVSAIFSAVIPESDRITVYLRGTVSPVFVSEKAFSYPAKSGNIHFGLGLDVTADLYQNDESAKWGFSAALHASYPIVSKSFNNDFNSSDITDRHMFMLFGAGTVFRCTPSTYIDVTLAVRACIMTYDYFKSGIILGAAVEPKVDIFFTDDFFLTGGFSLADGIVKFTPGHSDKWFESGYTTVMFRAQIGAGYRFGGDRKR